VIGTFSELASALRPIALPIGEVSPFHLVVEKLKPVLPIAALLVVLPLMKKMFGQTWRELDLEAQEARAKILEEKKNDTRPMVALAICAVVLTLQEYYGGRGYFEIGIKPTILALSEKHTWIKLAKYDELWAYGWWATTRVVGYVSPIFVWKLFYREDSILDFGLRTRGFFKHIWIYALFLAIVLPAMFAVASAPDFGSYYPFYKGASRSWFDLLIWESMYFAQFFALELFFRGFWVRSLAKSFGSGAIFAMAVPYCMIHFGKPYLEACGAIIAGIALGSLSMKTKSIYQGFLVHITVAGLMDFLALSHRSALPKVFWPPIV